MTTKERVARGKLSLLELTTELDNANRICVAVGCSRRNW